MNPISHFLRLDILRKIPEIELFDFTSFFLLMKKLPVES